MLQFFTLNDNEVGLGILSKKNWFQFEPDGGDNIELVWYQLPIIEMGQKYDLEKFSFI